MHPDLQKLVHFLLEAMHRFMDQNIRKFFCKFRNRVIHGSLALSCAFSLLNFQSLESSNFCLPKLCIELEGVGYCSVYDTRNKTPYYVYESLTPESVTGSFRRQGISFREDKRVPKCFRSTLRDYRGSGYDRGHMCPAGDCTGFSEAMESSFLLTNIGPQHPSLNRGLWSRLERRVRSLALECDIVEVFTGCLFLPTNCEDGKRRVIYEVIGEGNVAVPTHFFKVLLLHYGGAIKSLAYVLPNREIEKHTDLERFQSKIEKVQEAAGVIFHPG